MPEVDGKKYPYTAKGMVDAAADNVKATADVLTSPARAIATAGAKRRVARSNRDLERARGRHARGEKANPEANKRMMRRKKKMESQQKSTSTPEYSAPEVQTGPRAKTPATRPIRP